MDRIRKALERGETIDITTVGRKTGLPRRIEIGFTNVDGRLFIYGGNPGPRDWLANLRVTPRFTLHLKESVQADLNATARVVTDETKRREIFSRLMSPEHVEGAVRSNPLVEVVVDV